MRFTTSKNRITEEIYNKIKSMDVDIVQVGGSGKKSLLLLEGNAEFYIYLGKRTSKWDICASEALLECFGVIFNNILGIIKRIGRLKIWILSWRERLF